jgi:hypothetical protein
VDPVNPEQEAYSARCRAALKAQGLDVLADRIRARDHYVGEEQMGGFNMALVGHYLADDLTEEVVTASSEGDGTYWIARMPLRIWEAITTSDVDPPEAEEADGLDDAVRTWLRLAGD